MPKSERKVQRTKVDNKVNYTVTIDGVVHELQSGGEVKELLTSTLGDGRTHTVTVAEAREEESEATHAKDVKNSDEDDNSEPKVDVDSEESEETEESKETQNVEESEENTE